MLERPPPPSAGGDWAWPPAWFLAAVFLAAGLAKLVDLPGFTAILDTYRLLPAPLLWPLAVAVVLVEWAIALGLVLPTRRRAAALAAGLLLLGCGTAVGTVLLRGLELVNCGRFGVFLARPPDGMTLLQDMALLGLALFVLVAGEKQPQG
ncbi:MauE/DoxX family redox-associated membrane protein [Falsiroseomonas tokyonensis]|uniref:Methylamine utilization protein MauE n=1 Tax=Falsiroseomonas tokyonensis TaxID=430521 RepID=A0ABV7BZF3_9PROT|nr:DoxX family membrane protein [Falsiroseomonas tokyonensis]